MLGDVISGVFKNTRIGIYEIDTRFYSRDMLILIAFLAVFISFMGGAFLFTLYGFLVMLLDITGTTFLNGTRFIFLIPIIILLLLFYPAHLLFQ